MRWGQGGTNASLRDVYFIIFEGQMLINRCKPSSCLADTTIIKMITNITIIRTINTVITIIKTNITIIKINTIITLRTITNEIITIIKTSSQWSIIQL